MAGKNTADASSSHVAPVNTLDSGHAPVSTHPPMPSVVPKFTRLQFPRYDGRDDPISWLHHCEKFFKAQNTLAHEFVSTTAFHLTGLAQMWHFRLELEEPEMSWQQFKQRCFLRFGPGLRSNVLSSLAKLNREGRHIEEYNDAFQSMLMRTTTVRRDHEVDLYTASLDEWLRIDVENQRPTNLDIAMNVARLFFRRHECAPRSSTSPFVEQTPTAHNTLFTPFAGGSACPDIQNLAYAAARPGRGPPATAATSSAGSRSATPPRSAASQSRISGGSRNSAGTVGASLPLERQLSRSEYAHRRSKGLCFHCDERWSPAHNWKHLFFLVIDETSAIEEHDALDSAELDNPGISLHAITDTSNGSTMQVKL